MGFNDKNILVRMANEAGSLLLWFNHGHAPVVCRIMERSFTTGIYDYYIIDHARKRYQKILIYRNAKDAFFVRE